MHVWQHLQKAICNRQFQKGPLFAYRVIFQAFLPSADFFSKSTFSKNSFRNTIRVSNSLDPDQAQHFVGPDLGPNCLQRLSADDTSRHKFKDLII